MATTLPTFDVTDAQLTLMLQVFGDAEGYKTWLRQAIVNYVIQQKVNELRTQYKQAVDNLNAQAVQRENDLRVQLNTVVNPGP